MTIESVEDVEMYVERHGEKMLDHQLALGNFRAHEEGFIEAWRRRQDGRTAQSNLFWARVAGVSGIVAIAIMLVQCIFSRPS